MKKLLTEIARNVILRDTAQKIRAATPFLDMPAMQEKAIEDYEKQTPLTQFAVKQAEKFLKQQNEEKVK